MMGRQTSDQAQLFYEFCLEDRVPDNHLLRRINGFVAAALADLHDELAPFYSHTGRPSIDPELMIRMLVVGYSYGIRSERRLCEEVALNLAYRWFCRLDLEDEVPDHSSFSKNRHGRFRDSDILRHLFERVVEACIAAGLVKGEGFAVDASVMEADASRYHGQAPDEIDWSKIEKPSRAVQEYLEALDEAGELEPGRKPPKVVSPSDPASAWTAKANKRVQFGYGLNYLIDNDHAIIVDVEATPARTYDEVASTKVMIERTNECFGLKPDRLTADSAYGTGKFLAWLIGKDITPHVTVRDLSAPKDGTFSRADFTYDKDTDIYTCPSGKTLKTTGRIHADNTYRYLASTLDCSTCPLKQKCCPNMPSRRVPRDVNEAARDVARSLVDTPEFERSSHERKKVEMRFAHLKTHHRFERMRLRGLSGARDEFHLAAIVQNLKTMAMRLTSSPAMMQAR
ncbi:MAG: transposase [Hyphomicrobiaceae bacterium]|nr:transposase [Hyphomicrobiaceae bacterium]